MVERRRSGTRATGSRGRKSRASSRSAAYHVMPEGMERVQRGVRDILRLISEIPLLRDLHERERSVLAEVVEIVRCPGGTVLYQQDQFGSHLYILLQGRVEIRSQVGPGIFHSMRDLGDGDVAGLDAALSGGDYHTQARALDKTAALRIRTDTLRKFVEAGQPAGIKLFVALTEQLGQQIRAATDDVVRILEKSAKIMAANVKKRDGEYDDDDMRRILGG